MSISWLNIFHLLNYIKLTRRLDTNPVKPLIYIKSSCVQKNIIEINLPSELESIDKAVAKAVEFATACGFSEEELFGVDLAVRESVTNAIKHGNKFDESKDVIVSMENVENSLIIIIRDFGDGFAVDEVPDPTNPENLLKDSGRGILFMNNFMDSIEWLNHSEGGTVVKMTKKH